MIRSVMLAMCLLIGLSALALASEAFELSDIVVHADPPATQVMHESLGTWGFTGKGKKATRGRFVAYTPKHWDQKKQLPVLVFLHGAGARTEYRDNIDALYEEYFLKRVRKGKQIEAIVLCPQVSSYWGSQGVEFLDQAIKHYEKKIDKDRIYLTGLSSGGGGAWTAMVERHKLLAAAVPICGIRKDTKKDAVLVNLPIWAFHNKYDPYQKVEYTRAHVKAIREAGGQYLHYTEYEERPGKSHMKKGKEVFPKCHAQAWEAAYDDPKMWDWLFKQRKGKPELSLIKE